MSNPLLVDRLRDTVVITFNRPQIRSPLSVHVLEQLHLLVQEFAGETKVEKVVFTGRNRVFASGADLREIARINADTAREFAMRGQTLMTSIAGLPQVTIAAIDGYCFGGALDLALACDRRIASPGSTFSHPGASLGIITGWGGTQRLPRLIGQAAAMEMFFTAKRVSSDEALATGLVDEVASDPRAAALEFQLGENGGQRPLSASLPTTSPRRPDE